MNELIGNTFAIAIVGVVLFLVALYLLAQRDADPPEERGFDLEDFRADREEDE